MLKKKNILIYFLILFCFSISNNAFSIKHWERNYVSVTYPSPERERILITFKYFDYNFGPNNQHGFLEYCDYEYSVDGVNYIKLASSESKDQSEDVSAWVNMTDKLPGAKIKFYGTIIFPANKKEIVWEDNMDLWLSVKIWKELGTASIVMTWILPENVKIKNIRISGKWASTGIVPPEYFYNEIYDIRDRFYTPKVKTDITPNYKSAANIDQSDNDEVKIYKNTNEIILKNTVLGENINIYTNKGILIKSVVSDDDMVKIKLPSKQVYIINIGKAKYKVAM